MQLRLLLLLLGNSLAAAHLDLLLAAHLLDLRVALLARLAGKACNQDVTKLSAQHKST